MTARPIPLQLVTQICERTTRPRSSAKIQVACSSCRPPIALPTPWSPRKPRSRTPCKWTKSRRVVQQLVATSRVRCTRTWPNCLISTFSPYQTRSALSCKWLTVVIAFAHSSPILHQVLLSALFFSYFPTHLLLVQRLWVKLRLLILREGQRPNIWCSLSQWSL